MGSHPRSGGKGEGRSLGSWKRQRPTGARRSSREELGDLLFAIVNLSRFIKVDPEFALQKATGKFMERFRLLEGYAQEEDLDLAALDLDGLNELWDRAKDYLRKKPQA